MIKRFAFWPLLALVSMGLGSAPANPDHGSTAGTLVGLAISVPLAVLVDRRRQRRWATGRSRRLFP